MSQEDKITFWDWFLLDTKWFSSMIKYCFSITLMLMVGLTGLFSYLGMSTKGAGYVIVAVLSAFGTVNLALKLRQLLKVKLDHCLIDMAPIKLRLMCGVFDVESLKEKYREIKNKRKVPPDPLQRKGNSQNDEDDKNDKT